MRQSSFRDSSRHIIKGVSSLNKKVVSFAGNKIQDFTEQDNFKLICKESKSDPAFFGCSDEATEKK